MNIYSKYSLTLIVFIIIAFSCSNKKELPAESLQKSEMIKREEEKKQVEELERIIALQNRKPTLLKKSITRNFSDPVKKDRFVISIEGKTILEGEFKFRIISSDSVELLNEKYPANYLIGYGLDPESSVEDQENFIRKRIDEFFEDDNFNLPAIQRDQVYDMDYSDEEIWNDIMSDSTSVGFNYLIGEESGCRIAYSKKMKKVVQYFCCC
jgi:hypothetical protein